MERRTQPPQTYAEKLLYVEVFDETKADWIPWSDPNECILWCCKCGYEQIHIRLTEGWMCPECGEFVPIVEIKSERELLAYLETLTAKAEAIPVELPEKVQVEG